MGVRRDCGSVPRHSEGARMAAKTSDAKHGRGAMMRTPGRRAASGAEAYTEENATEAEVGRDVHVVVMELPVQHRQRAGQ